MVELEIMENFSSLVDIIDGFLIQRSQALKLLNMLEMDFSMTYVSSLFPNDEEQLDFNPIPMYVALYYHVLVLIIVLCDCSFVVLDEAFMCSCLSCLNSLFYVLAFVFACMTIKKNLTIISSHIVDCYASCFVCNLHGLVCLLWFMA